ncbi:hypothetical protein Rsub_06313 [Raphidocelis subcapitata]|uniref:Ketoreductase domain-containing protein n=1 Tax=Raphidocelis subcapitata TaxID=307507 RepID=A0A2V0P6U0_9CHLO|nr:hypothetical protein Rsub_06313 [Raphidocelis subcapitata]|eukprot:GBF93593.1 hypothetical protein Rsub_06313 [Raphidocelis subcapitata]
MLLRAAATAQLAVPRSRRPAAPPGRGRAAAVAAAAAGARAAAADLSGRTFLVTGSTDGIGRHTAQRLAAAGACVLVHGRDAARVDAAVAAVRAAAAAGAAAAAAGAAGSVRGYVADLASLESVRSLAEAVRADHPGGIDTLVNNAGVFAPERPVKSRDGFELTWAVNVLAPFLLTAELLDKVTSHVITTSSISASSSLDEGNLQQERGYSAHSAYSASKCCNQIFTLALARKLEAAGSPVLTNTLDPGTVNTKMLLAGWGRIGIEVRDANNTFELAADPGPRGLSGQYYVSGRASRPVPAARDEALQERLWALWERQTGRQFQL